MDFPIDSDAQKQWIRVRDYWDRLDNADWWSNRMSYEDWHDDLSTPPVAEDRIFLRETLAKLVELRGEKGAQEYLQSIGAIPGGANAGTGHVGSPLSKGERSRHLRTRNALKAWREE